MNSERRRLFVVATTLFSLFLLLIARFYQVQILEHEKWKKEAFQQHQHIVIEPARRGSFYSNPSVRVAHPEEPQPFVIDVQKFHLFIDPDSIPKQLKETMARELFMKLGLHSSKWVLFFKEFEKKSRSRKLAGWLSYEERKEIQQWWKTFAKRSKIVGNALFFRSQYLRSYPFGSLLGAVLHTVRADQDPQTNEHIPTGGLELYFHSYLEGRPGKKRILRSLRRSLEISEILQTAQDGADIYLTVNHYLQAIVESELAKGVEVAGGRGGIAVMMDPFNGEILALAQTPAFNPSAYADYFNQEELQEHTRVKALCDAFEPASIFKPITLAICLKANEELIAKGEAPLFSPEEKIPTSNGWFPGRSFPLKDGRAHSFLNMSLAMQKSSNVYIGRLVERIVQRMGNGWYRAALVDMFAFGKKTQLELPGETPGLVPTPGKLHPNGTLEWSTPTPYSLGIGHNIMVNAIQMTRAYAIIANGGKAVQPHLVRKIIRKKDGKEEVLVDNSGYRAHEQVLTRASTAALIRAMKFTTKEGGTAKRGDIMGYTEAGKSGTSEKIIGGQYSRQKYYSIFVGFAPVEKPRFVLFVLVDEPELKFIPGVGRHQHGGVSASPIFREIGYKTLQYLGVTPDDPYGYPYGDPRRDPKKADWMAEVKELKEVYDSWN